MTAATETNRRKGGDRLDTARLLIGVVAVLLLGTLVWSVFDSRDDADQAQQETRSLAQQVATACNSGGAAARELDAIGACQKAATAAAGAPPPEADLVYQVATDDQVRSAVSEYLRLHPPADGRIPSTAEVEAAVTRVCQAIGCQGRPGSPGTPGDDGEDGDDGQDASDTQVATQVAVWCGENNGCLPTAEDIQAAVAAYCSADPSPCMGPAGVQGAQGPAGPVLPEYYETNGGLTRHCVIQPQEDAAAPPHYECTPEIP